MRHNNLENVKWLAIKELTPHPKNPNKHPKDQIDRLAEILKYQGFRQPIVISNRSGLVVAGHGRIEAAKKNKWSTVPVVYQDFDDEAQEYAHLTADNAIASWAELQIDEIKLEAIAIEGMNPDMLGIKDLTLDDNKYEDKDADAVPEVAQNELGVQLGDIYQLGEHRLMCGDSTDLATVEKLMNGEKADMVFTDPPYELETQGGGLLKESSAMKKIKALGIDKFDPSTLTQHAATSVYCCNKPLISKYITLAEKWGVSWDLCVYHKQNITPNYGGHLMTDLEYLLVIGKQAPRTGIGEDKELYSKLYSGGKDADNETAWSKPVALCEKFIKLYSTKLVLDLFLGSGSTLIACEKTNRKCFGMELDPHYCSVIIKRWEQFTNKKAVKL